MPIATDTTATLTRTDHDDEYAAFLRAVRDTFTARTAGAPVLFLADATGLWDRYLDGLPTDRQTHTCHTCRHFFERFAGAVVLSEDGIATPVLWGADAVPTFYRASVAALADAVARARVASVLRPSAPVLGVPTTGPWSHIAIELPPAFRHRDRVRRPEQVAAELRENVGIVARALAEFSPAALDEALRVLEADALSRAERFVGPVRWLRELHTRRVAAADSRVRDAILWRAVATAPAGFCHPRSSVVGPLLEMVIAGEPYETIRAKWEGMLHPLRYQRPQAAPAAGNIAVAEKIVADLGLAPSLERRFARLDECETTWTPKVPDEAPASTPGVFAHLAPKTGGRGAVSSVDLPAQTVTWEKFARTVLPTAERMELRVPASGNYTALVTATHADAPPIVRWDREDRRNPVTAYVYHGGSPASRWGLSAGAWHPVTAVVPRPNLWGDQPQPQHGDGLVLVLAGAVDSGTGQGNALFPETLRADLHGIRATVEAYSRRAELTGREDASACGYGINKGQCGVTLRVWTGGRSADYRIDRWD